MKEKIEKIVSLILITKRITHEHLKKQNGENFSFLQFATLQQINEKKPLMKDLADFLAITPPSATALINNLAKAKMIKRITDSKDRRIVRIEITENGKMQLEKCRKEMLTHMKSRLEKLNDVEQEDLIRILTKLVEV